SQPRRQTSCTRPVRLQTACSRVRPPSSAWQRTQGYQSGPMSRLRRALALCRPSRRALPTAETMSVKLSDLRKHAADPAIRLRCEPCQATYSANPGDYWYYPQNRTFKCQCTRPLSLVTVNPQTYTAVK